MGKHREHLVNDMALMPGRVVDDQHDPGVVRGRIGTGNIPEVFGKSLLQVPPFRHRGCPRLPWTRHQPCRQMAGDEVEGAIQVAIGMTIQVAHEGAMPLDLQCGPERGDEREAGFILAQ